MLLRCKEFGWTVSCLTLLEYVDSVTFIRAADGAAKWNGALESFDDVDIYAQHGYIQASAGDDALLAVVTRNGASLALPLAPRILPDGLLYDAESPYGYPGVLTRGSFATCWPLLSTALAGMGIINVFLRLHPFVNPDSCVDFSFVSSRPTASIPLLEGRAMAFAGSSCTTHRSQVCRARRLGFTSTRVQNPSLPELETFAALYQATMIRLRAREVYHFGVDYFIRLAAGLREALVLIKVLDPSQRAVSQALMLCGKTYGHYHLSARSEEAHNVSSHLLFESMADEAAARQISIVHLGGGISNSPQDSLLAFKRRAGRQASCVVTAGLVCDPQRHNTLIQSWARKSQRTPCWFQSYREPF